MNIGGMVEVITWISYLFVCMFGIIIGELFGVWILPVYGISYLHLNEYKEMKYEKGR